MATTGLIGFVFVPTGQGTSRPVRADCGDPGGSRVYDLREPPTPEN